MDKLATDHYERHYAERLAVVVEEKTLSTEPEIRKVAMRYHDESVDRAVGKGWEVLGTAEFNTSDSPRRNHLRRKAQRLGAGRVVLSSLFDRRVRDVVRRNEFVPGNTITVNGTTVHMPGRWEPTLDVVTYEYYDFRATFLRRDRE